jgi:hypothetical protein
MVLAVDNCRSDALFCLLHRLIRKAHNRQGWQATRSVDFHLDWQSLQPAGGAREGSGKHSFAKTLVLDDGEDYTATHTLVPLRGEACVCIVGLDR